MVSRSVFDGAGDWSAAQAVDLLVQGYSEDRVVAVTGFDRRWVRYQASRIAPHGEEGSGGDAR